VHTGMSAEEAMTFVKTRRPHVSLGDAQRAAVEAFQSHHASTTEPAAASIREKAAGVGSAVSDTAAAVAAADGIAGGAVGVAVAAEEDEPTAIALKKKPTIGTWCSRFLAIRDKQLLIFVQKEQFDSFKQQRQQAEDTEWRLQLRLRQEGELQLQQPQAAPAATGERTTSISDLTGCTFEKGMEKFMLNGVYFKLSVKCKAGTEGFNQRGDKEAHFAFQAEYDRDRFYNACMNLAEGRKWNEGPVEAVGGGGAAADAEPEPELAAPTSSGS
jgi:hypothetical protein